MLKKILSEAREDPVALGLAMGGAVAGAYNYYLKPELTAGRGWGVLGAYVLAFDLLGEQTLSSYAKGRCEASVWPRVAIGYTALHLMGAVPENIDPLTQLHKYIKGAA